MTFLAAAAVLSAACQREETLDMRRNEVSFTVATGYENGPATRTEYSGERYMVGSTSYERIDWVAGDVIRIASDKAATSDGASYADYTVQSASPESEKSIAGVSSSSPLTWGGGTNTFYGLYPAPGVDGVDSGVSFTEAGVATLVLPADQSSITMKYAYMGAATTASSGSSVSLSFKPLMNAYCFKLLGEGDSEMKLKSLTLSSDDCYLVAPSYTVTLNASDNTFGSVTYTEGTASKSITATFGGGDGVDLPTSGIPFTHTFFALPEDQINLRLTLTFIEGTTEMSRSFNLTGLSVSAGQKVNLTSSNITVPEAWEYTLGSLFPITMEYEGGQGTLASTFVSYRTSPAGVVEPVPFRLEYSTDDGENWSTERPSWITPATANKYDGSWTGTSLSLTLTHANYADVLPNEEIDHAEILRAATPKEDFDLSTLNVATGVVSEFRSTANCYVVQASGTYRFPLVYGNALKEDAVNSTSFKYQGTDGTLRQQARQKKQSSSNWAYQSVYSDYLNLTTFKAHAGSISQPYIASSFGNLSAALLWTDAPGLVQEVQIEGEGADAYISFTVPRGTIAPGNAVIAVKTGSTIAWSWHIWVTDLDLTVTTSVGGGYRMPTVNLGSTDVVQLRYPSYACMVRAVQLDASSGEPDPYGKVTAGVDVQKKATVVTQSEISTLYEFGRKDPLFASSSSKQYWNASGESISVPAPKNVGQGPNITSWHCGIYASASLALGIQNPTLYYYGYGKGDGGHGSETYGGCEWASDTYRNLWDNNPASNTIAKTVYDPCPVGFVVPPGSASAKLTRSMGYRNCTNSGKLGTGTIYWTCNYIENGEWIQHNTFTSNGEPWESYHVKHPYYGTAMTSTGGTSKTHLSNALPIRPVIDLSMTGSLITGGMEGQSHDGNDMDDIWENTTN